MALFFGLIAHNLSYYIAPVVGPSLPCPIERLSNPLLFFLGGVIQFILLR